MKMKDIFRIVGLLEALSCAVLFGIAMPMKYLGMSPTATQMPGMVHGMLFLGYVCLAFKLADDENWSKGKLCTALGAGVVPFGTYYFDRKFMS